MENEENFKDQVTEMAELTDVNETTPNLRTCLVQTEDDPSEMKTITCDIMK